MLSIKDRLWHHELLYLLGHCLHTFIKGISHHSSEELGLKLNCFQIRVHETSHDYYSSHFIRKLVCIKSEFFHTFDCWDDAAQSFYLSVWKLLIVNHEKVILKVVFYLNWSRMKIRAKRFICELDVIKIRKQFLFFEFSFNLFRNHLFYISKIHFKFFF